MKTSLRKYLAFFIAAITMFSLGCSSDISGASDSKEPLHSDVPTDTTENTGPTDTEPADIEPADTEAVKPDPPKGDYKKMVFTSEFEKHTFTASNGEELPYCLYVPKDYSEDYAYPMLTFFHGAGRRSNENGEQVTEAVQGLYMPKGTPIYDAIAVFPLCDPDSMWVDVYHTISRYSIEEVKISRNMQAVVELLDFLMEKYSINPNRQYVIGFSMGGYGTWDIIMRYPDRFAAAAPFCGGGDPSVAASLVDIPLWVNHDSTDDIVDVSGSRDMVNAIKEAGGELVIYNETDWRGHNVWDYAYGSAEFQEWLFSQVKK
ncbi:MAG: dienelactone hydrolase family protein [Clostridia bacterium]|nr:dienelactone hydrolase family protein [Clostridia bacterium]